MYLSSSHPSKLHSTQKQTKPTNIKAEVQKRRGECSVEFTIYVYTVHVGILTSFIHQYPRFFENKF